MDAIFSLACTTAPWRAIPPEHGNPDTIARHFRRLTHNGLWEKLLQAIADSPADHPLRAIAPLVFRACRRAIRLRGLGLIALIRRLGFLQALNGPPHKICHPDLSEIPKGIRFPPLPETKAQHAAFFALLKSQRALHRLVGGVIHIRRAERLGWS
jgi:hypothetical protein